MFDEIKETLATKLPESKYEIKNWNITGVFEDNEDKINDFIKDNSKTVSSYSICELE